MAAPKFTPTMERESGPDTIVRVVVWSTLNDDRTTFDGYTSLSDACDLVEKLTPFVREDVRMTVERLESTTFRADP